MLKMRLLKPLMFLRIGSSQYCLSRLQCCVHCDRDPDSAAGPGRTADRHQAERAGQTQVPQFPVRTARLAAAHTTGPEERRG